MRIVVLVTLNQVDISFCVESIFEYPDHVGRSRQSEDSFLMFSILCTKRQVSVP